MSKQSKLITGERTHVGDRFEKLFKLLTSFVHEGALLRFWEDGIDDLHDRMPGLLKNLPRCRDVGGPETDAKLIVDDLKGFQPFRLAVCFDEGPGRLDCCNNGCG
jgi:hypothetical protein